MPTDRVITDLTIAEQVVRTLDGRDAEFDVDAIVREIQSVYGLVDIDTIDNESFWDLVARHAREV